MEEKKSLFHLLLFMCALFGAPSQGDATGGEFVERWSGFNEGYSPTACVLRIPYAYLASDGGIDVVELTDIDSPVIVNQIPLSGGQPDLIRLANDTLLIAVSESHVVVLDLTLPEDPEILLDLSLPTISGADMKGTDLFVSESPSPSGGKIFRYDVSSWQNPERIDSLYWNPGFNGVRIAGDLLLAETLFTDNEDFFIYRIIDPAGLQFLNWWTPPAYWTRSYDFVDSTGVFVFDLQGVVTIQTVSLSQTDGTVTQLWSSGELVDRDPWSLTVSDSLVMVYAAHFGIVKSTSILSSILRSDGSLSFVDTLDLGLNRSSSINIYYYVERPIAVVDSIALWCTSEGVTSGVVNNDTRVVPRGFAKTHERCLGLDGIHDTIFVLTTDRLYAMGFTTPTNPDTLGTLPLVSEGVKVLNDNRLLAFDSVLTLIDVTNIGAPAILDTMRIGRNAFGRTAAASDSLVAIATLERGVAIVRFAGDDLFFESNIPIYATDVAWRGDTLLVSELDNFMSVWYIGDPTNPTFLTYLAGQSGTSNTLATTDTILAVGTFPFVYLYDISSLLDPVLIGQHFLYSGTILRYRFLDGLLYAYMGAETFSVFDLGDSLSFANLATARYPDGDASFYASDTSVFLAAGLSGLKALVLDTTVASISLSQGQMPDEAILLPNYPNPFNAQTRIQYEVSERTDVQLEVFDLLGRRVAVLSKGLQDPGSYNFLFDGSKLASGVYFSSLRTEAKLQVRRMLLQR